jgi:replicative DNA helicase
VNTGELEKIIVGMILNDSENFEKAKLVGIQSGMFINPEAQNFWNICEESKKNNTPIELAAICLLNPKDQTFLVDAVTNASVTQNFQFYAQMFFDMFVGQKIALEMSALAKEMLTHDYSRGSEGFRAKLLEIYKRFDSTSRKSAGQFTRETAIKNFIDTLEKRILGEEKGLPVKSEILSRALNGGFRKGKIYVVAARTSVGKTTLALNFGSHITQCGGKVVFCSNEMDHVEMTGKEISLRSKVSGAWIERGEVGEKERDRIMETIRSMSKDHFTIDEKSGRSIEVFENMCRKKHREGMLDIVFLDLIQQMRITNSVRGYDRPQEISIISDRLKELSRELKIPIVMMAQLNREFEKSKNARPNLSHIKDSGSLEQDADVVLILYRDQLNQLIKKQDDFSEEYRYKLYVAKNRFGRIGEWDISADLEHNYFGDL